MSTIMWNILGVNIGHSTLMCGICDDILLLPMGNYSFVKCTSTVKCLADPHSHSVNI